MRLLVLQMEFCSSIYTDKQLKNQLTNTFIGNHDLVCGCNKPAIHCFNLILENQLCRDLKPETIKKIKCLLTEDGGLDRETKLTVADQDDGPGFEEGDLEALFNEDFTEEDTG